MSSSQPSHLDPAATGDRVIELFPGPTSSNGRGARAADELVGDRADAGTEDRPAEVKEIDDLDPDLAAFQIDAALIATNTALRLGDPHASDRARLVTDESLAAPTSD